MSSLRKIPNKNGSDDKVDKNTSDEEFDVHVIKYKPGPKSKRSMSRQMSDEPKYKRKNFHEKTSKFPPTIEEKNKVIDDSEKKPSKRSRMECEVVKESLENVINNPGLQHLAENIFSYLNYQDITACQLINNSCNLIISNPRFWINKLVQMGMSMENKKDWITAIQMTKNTDFERNIYLYLKRGFKNAKVVDIPCFIGKDIFELIQELPLSEIKGQGKSVLNESLKKILPLNAPGCIQIFAGSGAKSFRRIMFSAAEYGYLEVVKTLAFLMKKPNASYTPEKKKKKEETEKIMSCHVCEKIFITKQALYCHISDKHTLTPIYMAARNGHLDVIKFLAPISDNFSSMVNDLKLVAELYDYIILVMI